MLTTEKGRACGSGDVLAVHHDSQEQADDAVRGPGVDAPVEEGHVDRPLGPNVIGQLCEAVAKALRALASGRVSSTGLVVLDGLSDSKEEQADANPR